MVPKRRYGRMIGVKEDNLLEIKEIMASLGRIRQWTNKSMPPKTVLILIHVGKWRHKLNFGID
jgi:hypothetical protein